MNETVVNQLIYKFIGKYSANDIKILASNNADLLALFKQSYSAEFNMIVLMNKLVRYKVTMSDVLDYLSEHYISLRRLILLDPIIKKWLERNINNLNDNI